MLRRQVLVLCLFAILACNADTPPAAKAPAGPPPSATNTPPPSTSSGAPSATSRPQPPLSREALARRGRRSTPFLWSVGKNGKTRAHLFGTVHLGIDAKRELNRVVWQTFDQAKTFVMEADPGALQPTQLKKYALLPEGQTLNKELPEASLKRLQANLGPTMMGVQLTRLRPWMLSAALTRKFTPVVGKAMDVAFHEAASGSAKSRKYLETPQQQLELLAEAINAKALKDMLDDLRQSRQMVRDALRAYRAGDFNGLQKALFDSKEIAKNPGMYRKLFDERNARWIPQIEQVLASSGAFIAVGAGHLMGPSGLTTQLRKRGYTIRRVQALAEASPPRTSAQQPKSAPSASK